MAGLHCDALPPGTGARPPGRWLPSAIGWPASRGWVTISTHRRGPIVRRRVANSRFGGLKAAMPRGMKAPAGQGRRGRRRAARVAMRQGVGMSDDEVDFSRLVRRESPDPPFRERQHDLFREANRAMSSLSSWMGRSRIRSGIRWFETVAAANGIFGEMALIDESPRSATAVALTDVTVVADHRKAVPLPGSNTCRRLALMVMRVPSQTAAPSRIRWSDLTSRPPPMGP